MGRRSTQSVRRSQVPDPWSHGWIRVTVTNSKSKTGTLTATITEYGYETIANKLVLAGLPSKNAEVAKAPGGLANLAGASLGMLALGADGLSMWRRDDSDSTASQNLAAV